MPSPIRAISTGAAIVALGGVMLLAQPFDHRISSVLGAETDRGGGSPVEFTAAWTWGPAIRAEVTTLVPNGTQHRGGAWRPGVRAEASDPRWQGTLSIAANWDDFGTVGGPEVGLFAFRVENEEGAWQQLPTASLTVPGVDDEFDRGIFVGEGGYEGFVAVVDITGDPVAQTWELHGYIIEGELPPPPEPVVGSAAS